MLLCNSGSIHIVENIHRTAHGQPWGSETMHTSWDSFQPMRVIMHDRLTWLPKSYQKCTSCARDSKIFNITYTLYHNCKWKTWSEISFCKPACPAWVCVGVGDWGTKKCVMYYCLMLSKGLELSTGGSVICDVDSENLWPRHSIYNVSSFLLGHVYWKCSCTAVCIHRGSVSSAVRWPALTPLKRKGNVSLTSLAQLIEMLNTDGF